MNLVVYASGTYVGLMDMADGEPFYGFTYSPAYLNRPDAAPLSLSLPLQSERFSGKEALPFFEGLLPEGNVRASIAYQLGISENSPSKLLRALGRDCAGDITVLEEDDPYIPPSNDAYAPLEHGLSGLAKNPLMEISRIRQGGRLSLAGGQEKIGLYHDKNQPLDQGWFIPIQGSPSTHIIKPQVREEYPHLILNEFLCMKLASLIGLPVALADLVVLDCPLLVVQRFDRTQTGQVSADGLMLYGRLRQEDCCQALGYASAQKYESDGGPTIKAIVDLLLRNSANYIGDRRTMLQMMLFNYLVGNCDAHGKNYSLMLEGKRVRLAPAYDLISTTVYDGSFGNRLSHDMGMRIGLHSNIDRITHEDFDRLCDDFRLSKDLFYEVARGLVARLQQVFHDDAALVPRQGIGLSRDVRGSLQVLAERISSGIEKRSQVLLG